MTLTALLLCISLLIMPVQVAAAPQDENKTVYISEVKVGMGETSEEASKELLAEGYTILKESDGSYVDVNYEAGTKSGLKSGVTQRIVYIGYKTTTNPKEAITDLAVMNMNGGYSIQDYKTLMANHLEGEIKPFVNRFIAALKEYRENYNKPADSLAHIRADYYRQMLNKLTDDDTGGKPLGDLLLNETKYEMGDNKYNALSNAEKKNHADILTLLMQGNAKAILLIETLVTKATDSADDSWFDRFLKTDLDGLKAEIKNADPSLTTEADINAELDKRYNDTASQLLYKWDGFYDMIASYDDNVNAVVNTEIADPEELKNDMENVDIDNLTMEDVDTIGDAMDKENEIVNTAAMMQEIAVVDFLSSAEYDDGSLLEFFEREKSDFYGEGIRELYPIAASLSKGQIAGLDFLSFKDLFSLAITEAEGYRSLDISDMTPASVFQDVDRAIYKPGGVALTNAALRQQASANDDDSEFMLSPLGFVYWGLTAVSLAATITSVVLYNVFEAKAIALQAANLTLEAETIPAALSSLNETYSTLSAFFGTEAEGEAMKVINSLVKKVTDSGNEMIDNMAKIETLSAKSSMAVGFSIAFTIVTVVIALYSIYTTIDEMIDYYKVDFTPIPRYIVEETDISREVNGVKTVINNQTAYYKVVQCNRKQKIDHKDPYWVLGTANDLNGDVGKQWLALYSVKYEYGSPILADSLMVQKGKSDLPKGYETGIHRFGEGAAFNLTSKYYCYNDTPKGTYVFFKNDEKTVEALTMSTDTTIYKTVSNSKSEENTTGSMFSTGTVAISAVSGLLIGAALATIITVMIMKRKRKESADE